MFEALAMDRASQKGMRREGKRPNLVDSNRTAHERRPKRIMGERDYGRENGRNYQRRMSILWTNSRKNSHVFMSHNVRWPGDLQVQAQREVRKQSNIMAIHSPKMAGPTCIGPATCISLPCSASYAFMEIPTEHQRYYIPLFVLYRASNRISHRESCWVVQIQNME